jgi:hypothetical protein
VPHFPSSLLWRTSCWKQGALIFHNKGTPWRNSLYYILPSYFCDWNAKYTFPGLEDMHMNNIQRPFWTYRPICTVYVCMCNSMSLVPILNHTNLRYTLTSYLFTIHFNIILSSTPRSNKWSLHFRFSD